MKKFIALLRGINVGGHRKIKMADLKILLEKNKLKNVQTYIQSGNVVFESKIEDIQELENLIADVIKKTFDFDVPTMVVPKEKWTEVYVNTPFAALIETDLKMLHVTFLSEKPNQELIEELLALDRPLEEQFHFEDKQIYLYYPNGYGKTKFHNVLFEKKLKVKATTRNWRTVTKLNELAS